MTDGKMTHERLMENFHLLRDDPQRYLALAQAYVRDNPEDPSAYFSRHQA